MKIASDVFKIYLLTYVLSHTTSPHKVGFNQKSSTVTTQQLESLSYKTTYEYSDINNVMKEISTSVPVAEPAFSYKQGFTTEQKLFNTDFSEMTEIESDRTTSRDDNFEIQKQSTQATPIVQDDFCYIFWSCKKPDYVGPWYCNCDERCEEYNDCCLEYNKTQNQNVSKNYGCVRRSNNYWDMFGFTAVTDCPEGYGNESVIELCKQDNIAEHGPPVADRYNSMIYNNKFCALCHSVLDTSPFDAQFYDFRMSDKEFLEFSNLSRDDKIRYSFNHASYQLKSPANIEIRSCIAGLIENDDFLCKQYVNPVLVGFRVFEIYRNYFCIPGNKKQWTKFCLGHRITDVAVDEIYSMSIIFSFRETKSNDIQKIQCQKWSEKMFNDPACSQLESYINFELKVEYYLVSSVNMTFEDMKRLSILSAWSFAIANLTELVYRFQIESNEYNTIAKVKITLKINKRSFLHEIENTKKIFNERTVYIVMKDNRSSERINIRSQQQPPQQQGNKTLTFINSFFIRLVWQGNFEKSMKDNYILNFSSVDKLSDELTITVLRTSGNMIYLESLHYHVRYFSNISNITPLSIITYACFSVSVFALICLIVYYRQQKLVSSIPISNVENLCVSLLISNLLFMIGIGAYQVNRLCYIIGITLHYLWLTVFSYMTISVIFIVTNIVKIRSRKTQGNDKTRRRRCMVTIAGLLIPLLFVGPAVAVDIFGPTYLSPGYGGKVCFPNRYPANVIFFSGPVVFSLALNFMCLISIIGQICRVRLSMRNIRKLEPYRDAKIYLRIVVLSGIFWVTGIFAVLFGSEELEYVFTILCGLQGVCVVVANVTTSHVHCQKNLGASKDDQYIMKEVIRDSTNK